MDFQQQRAGQQENIVGRVAVIHRTMWDRGSGPMSTRNGLATLTRRTASPNTETIHCLLVAVFTQFSPHDL
jgi:hypothetical protein